MRAIKQSLLSLFIRCLQHPSVRQELDRQFSLHHARILPLANGSVPYDDIARPPPAVSSAHQVAAGARRDAACVSSEDEGGYHLGQSQESMPSEPPVFITSRFRSGSTLLWNLFRQLEGCTSYYEPFNERQWFNNAMRGEGVDQTHKGVDDYWREYTGMAELSKWYCENWIREALYMDARSWDPGMHRYIQALIDRADGRAVLQFNRVDFRLGWLRHHFPGAPIVHLYRHPREQWLSFLTDKSSMTADTIEHSYRDGFYLKSWCADLQKHYPFLSPEHTPHPYQQFYYLWKLSYLHGRHYASVSIAFEDLMTQPEATISALLKALQWRSPADTRALAAMIDPPPMNRWRDFASDNWFCDHEIHCEQILDDYLSAQQPPGNSAQCYHGNTISDATRESAQ